MTRVFFSEEPLLVFCFDLRCRQTDAEHDALQTMPDEKFKGEISTEKKMTLREKNLFK